MIEKLWPVIYISLVASIFTGGVSAVHRATRRRIELNREIAEKRVMLEVLRLAPEGKAAPQQILQRYEDRVEATGISVEIQTGEVPVYAGRNESGETVGYAFEVSGRGFWDQVRGYVAMNPDLRTIRGIAFFQQNETPGLGAEITEPWFEAQFEGLTLPEGPGPDGRFVTLVRQGREKGPHDVDAITGATGTSKAVEEFLNYALWSFTRTMRGHRPAEGGGADG